MSDFLKFHPDFCRMKYLESIDNEADKLSAAKGL